MSFMATRRKGAHPERPRSLPAWIPGYSFFSASAGLPFPSGFGSAPSPASAGATAAAAAASGVTGAGTASSTTRGATTVATTSSSSLTSVTSAGRITSLTWMDLPSGSSETSTSMCSGICMGRHSTTTSRRCASKMPPSSVTPFGVPLNTMGTWASTVSVRLTVVKSTWMMSRRKMSRWTALTITVRNACAPSPLVISMSTFIPAVVCSAPRRALASTTTTVGSIPRPYTTAGTCPVRRSFLTSPVPVRVRTLASRLTRSMGYASKGNSRGSGRGKPTNIITGRQGTGNRERNVPRADRHVKTLLPLDPHHVPEILDLWSRRWGDQFPLDLALWQQNTDEDSRHFRAERCWVIEEDGVVRGCLALKVPDRPTAWPGQDPKHAWISVLVVEPGRDAELTEGLLDRALDWLRRAEFERVSYGGDPSHFFPGAPDDDRALRRMLETAGFRPGKLVYDLISDLGHHRVPD